MKWKNKAKSVSLKNIQYFNTIILIFQIFLHLIENSNILHNYFQMVFIYNTFDPVEKQKETLGVEVSDRNQKKKIG